MVEFEVVELGAEHGLELLFAGRDGKFWVGAGSGIVFGPRQLYTYTLGEYRKYNTLKYGRLAG